MAVGVRARNSHMTDGQIRFVGLASMAIGLALLVLS